MTKYSLYNPRNIDKRIIRAAPRTHTRLHVWLWAARLQNQLTQQELADKAGVSRQTIHAIETGKQWPTLLIALKLAAALDTDISKIFTLREHECCARHNEWNKRHPRPY